MKKETQIAPSILAANFAKLGDEVKAVDRAGADWIHLDVMDGHFVPALTFGPQCIKDLRPYSNKPFDVHLMISPIDPFLEKFAEAGADILTIHPEAGPHTHRTLQKIKALGKKAGLALNPATPIEVIEPVLEDIDLILVMSVNPGFGGQKFIDSQLKKITQLRKKVEKVGLDIEIEVDGGVTQANSAKIIEAGANVLVAGTSIFKDGKDYLERNILNLRH